MLSVCLSRSLELKLEAGEVLPTHHGWLRQFLRNSSHDVAEFTRSKTRIINNNLLDLKFGISLVYVDLVVDCNIDDGLGS